MTHTRQLLARMVTAVAFVAGSVTAVHGADTEKIREEVAARLRDTPFAMRQIPVPSFPDRRFSITSYGAVADGVTMNTRSIADAIDACARSGGGTVIVPPGNWLTGPVRLVGGINLHLDRGALLQFSNRIEDFPLIAGYDGRSKRYIITPPILAYRQKDVAITGEGIIDGAGERWRYVKRYKLTDQQWKELTASGGLVSPDGKEWWPSAEAMRGEELLRGLEKAGKTPTREDYSSVREFIRPDLVQLVQCNGVLLDGPTFQNSPKFHVRPIQSENVIIRDIKILCPWFAQNGDGLDPSSCRNVLIYDTFIDVGDDGLCLKPGSIGSSQTPGPACENIVISGCTVYHAHGGFVIGSETYGGVNNVSVRNCVFVGSDIGVRFKSYRGNGGRVKNVFIDGIQMRDIATDAVLFDMYYGGNSPDIESRKNLAARAPEPVTDRTPEFSDIVIKNVVCNGAGRAMLLNGLPEMPIRNVTFENFLVTATRGVVLADVEGIAFRGCRIAAKEGPLFFALQSRDVSVDLREMPATGVFLQIEGEKSENIRVAGPAAENLKQRIELGKTVKPDAVRLVP